MNIKTKQKENYGIADEHAADCIKQHNEPMFWFDYTHDEIKP